MGSKKLSKKEKRFRRRKRIRAKIFGTVERPRLSVFRSAKHIYCQLVDDQTARTLASASDFEIDLKKLKAKVKNSQGKDILKNRKVALAFEVGRLIAKKALEKKIEKVVFDRGGYKYHGRIKALAQGAREGGLKF